MVGTLVEGSHCETSVGFPILALLSAAACLSDKRIPAALNQASAGSSDVGCCSWERGLGETKREKISAQWPGVLVSSLDQSRSQTLYPLPSLPLPQKGKTYCAAFCASLALFAGSGNNIRLMYGPEGNSLFCFPESPDVSRDEGLEGKQN